MSRIFRVFHWLAIVLGSAAALAAAAILYLAYTDPQGAPTWTVLVITAVALFSLAALLYDIVRRVGAVIAGFFD